MNSKGMRKLYEQFAHSFAKNFLFIFGNLVLTFWGVGGNINKLSLMQQTKFDKSLSECVH